MQKNPDFQANQSNLLMGVVMIFVYGKRFRYAPSFNYKLFIELSNWLTAVSGQLVIAVQAAVWFK